MQVDKHRMRQLTSNTLDMRLFGRDEGLYVQLEALGNGLLIVLLE